jgi:hypothetical protein
MGENLSHKNMEYIYNTKMFTRRAKPIRINGVPLLFVALGEWMDPSWTIVTGDEQMTPSSSAKES